MTANACELLTLVSSNTRTFTSPSKINAWTNTSKVINSIYTRPSVQTWIRFAFIGICRTKVRDNYDFFLARVLSASHK